MIRRYLRSLGRRVILNPNTLRYPLELARIKEAFREIEPVGTLLDAGGGGGYYAAAFYVKRCRRVILVEPDAHNLSVARETLAGSGDRVRFLADGIQRIPLPNASVDCITCTQVLEHIVEDDAVVAEFARLLRPGGHALITVPTPPELYPNAGHVREGYTEAGLTELLERHGFSHRRTDWFLIESSMRLVTLLRPYGMLPNIFCLPELRASFQERAAGHPAAILGLFRRDSS